MLHKKAISFNIVKAEPLNCPEGWEIFNLPPRIKTASKSDFSKDDLGGFDLDASVKEFPDHLFLKIFAIEKDEVNDNGDAFCEAELKKAVETFIGVPIFTNHQNNDVEKAKGECVHSWYDEDEGGIYILARVDKVSYPPLARAIEQKYVKGTSMGASVEYSVCSICHNKAHVASEYCSCVKERKNRKFSGSKECAYHDSITSPEEDCPLCSKKKSESSKTIEHKDQQTFEHNYGIKFIENSFVVNPACHRCGVCDILHAPSVTQKVADIKASIGKITRDGNFKEKYHDDLLKSVHAVTKVADSEEDIKTDVKTAGQEELESLTASMANMERVVKSMLAQKEQVSMEYVSDLVKAMADVQNIADELMEMGYGQLASPTTAEVSSVQEQDIPESPDAFPRPAPAAPEASVSTQTGPSGISREDISGLGSITRPKKSSTLLNKKKDFVKTSSNVRRKIIALRQKINETLQQDRSPIVGLTSSVEIVDEASDDARRVIIAKEGDGIFVTEAKGEEIVKISSISEFPDEIQDLIETNPEKAGQHILSNKELNKEDLLVIYPS